MILCCCMTAICSIGYSENGCVIDNNIIFQSVSSSFLNWKTSDWYCIVKGTRLWFGGESKVLKFDFWSSACHVRFSLEQKVENLKIDSVWYHVVEKYSKNQVHLQSSLGKHKYSLFKVVRRKHPFSQDRMLIPFTSFRLNILNNFLEKHSDHKSMKYTQFKHMQNVFGFKGQY